MDLKRRARVLAAGKSPSEEAMKRTFYRATQNGGVTQDFSANVENIRELSRKLNYNVLQDAKFLYVPSSYGEGRNYTQNPSIRNLVRFSEDLTNAVWDKTNSTISANANLNPFGLNKSYYLVDDATNGVHNVAQNSRAIIGEMYSISYYVKKSSHSWIQFAHGSAFSSLVWTNFNFDTGLFGNKGSLGAWTSESLPNGWWVIKVTMTASANSTSNGIAIVAGINNTNAATRLPSYVGASSNVCDIAAIQAEKSSITTIYQRTTDGISDFTFTRATSSRTTNKLGIIEDSCYNLLLRSEEFDISTWTKQSGATITPNVAIAPNGTLTADRVDSLELAGGDRVFQTALSGISIAGTTFNGSIYLKGEGVDVGKDVELRIRRQTGTSVIQSFITTLTSDWVRINTGSMVGLSDNTGVIYSISRPGSNFASSVLVWGAQLERGTIMRPYLKTVDRLNVPSLDYSRSLLEPSLLIEPQRTNLLLQSGNLSSGWTATRGTLNTNTLMNPFGISNGYYFTEDDTSNTRIISRSGLSFTTGNIYTTSYYVKKADDSWIQLAYVSAVFGLNVWVNFNFDTGLFGNNGGTGNWTARQLTNGYWLLTLTATATATTSDAAGIISGTGNTNSATRIPSYLGAFRNVVNIAAIQLEVGSNATSYIPTTTATVTRNIETSYVDLWNNNMLNRTNFTLFVEGYLYSEASSNTSIALSDSTRISAFGNDLGWYTGIRPFISVGGVSNVPGGAVSLITGSYRFIIQYNNGSVNFFRNGIQIWTTQAVPVFDYRYLSVNSGSSTHAVDKIALFNRTLTNAECISLSNPTYTFEQLADAYQYTLIT